MIADIRSARQIRDRQFIAKINATVADSSIGIYEITGLSLVEELVEAKGDDNVISTLAFLGGSGNRA